MLLALLAPDKPPPVDVSAHLDVATIVLWTVLGLALLGLGSWRLVVGGSAFATDLNWNPLIAGLILLGPAIALASSGSAEAQTVEICSAIGSHSRFQVSRVPSTHSVGVQATAFTVPAGSAVAPSSQVSARCTASVIAVTVPAGIGAVKPMALDASCRARS